MFRTWFQKAAQDRMARAARRRKTRLAVELLEDRTVPSINPIIGDVFVIDMENHNLTQPAGAIEFEGNTGASPANGAIYTGSSGQSFTIIGTEPDAFQANATTVEATYSGTLLGLPGIGTLTLSPTSPVGGPATLNYNFISTPPQQLLGNPAAPYLNSLMTPGNPNAAQTSFASNYTNSAAGVHPSEPNYIWQEGGSNFGEVGNDDDPYASNNGQPPNGTNNNVNLIAQTNGGTDPANLSGLLQAAYGTAGWHSYQEDMQYDGLSVPTVSASGINGAINPYFGTTQYNFAVKHDGTLFYTDTNGGTLSGPGPAGATNTEAPYYSPLAQLFTDLANNKVAKYNLITPDQFNDMHSSLNTPFTYTDYTGATHTYAAHTDQEAIATGDNFLSIVVPEIMASKAYQNNGAIVLWFDETEGGDTSQFTLPEIVISPLAKGNAYNSTLAYTHSSDLLSLQELFGVSGPGGKFLGDSATPGTNDLSDMFVPGVFTPSALAGVVFKNSGNDGKVEAGVTVVLTGKNDAGQTITLTTTTKADGSYSFTGLLPGTYSVHVPDAKKDPGIDNIALGVGQTLGEEDFSLLGPNSHK
jgi:hypothetical protein